MSEASEAAFDPAAYWERRLREHTDIVGVGFIGRTPEFVALQYQQRMRQVDRALRQAGLMDMAGRSVLDVGAGIGFWLTFWHRHDADHVTGVDFTRASVERLQQEFPGDRIVHADVSARPLPALDGARFDVVSAFDVLLHIVDATAFDSAMGNLAALCQPGGWLITMDPLTAGYGYVPHHEEPVHVKVRSLAEYTRALEDHGFEVTHVLPATVLLNRPLEARNRLVYLALAAWWRASYRWERVRSLMPVLSSLALGLDRVACHFSQGRTSPSEKVVLARKR